MCLRPVVMYVSETYCPACIEVILRPDGTLDDIEYLTRALKRHIRKSLGYWPPRCDRPPIATAGLVGIAGSASNTDTYPHKSVSADEPETVKRT